MTPATCVCGSLPRFRFSTPVVIVQHNRERHKPTNTGRLFARMVEGTALLPYGIEGRPFDAGPLGDPSIEWRVLFPRKGAPVLDPDDGRRIGFVVLDGTWSQCARMSRRVPVVADLPCVALPPGPPPIWTVRTQHTVHGKSTFEAALQALQLREGADAVAPLRDAFAFVTDRLLRLKGKQAPQRDAAGHG